VSQVENPALPGWACSRASGRENFGRGCSRPRGRGTAVEAEATLSRKVAAEAEAGKTTGPTPFGTPEGEGGLRPAYREGRERQMSEGDTKTPLSSSERRGEEGLKLKMKTVKIVKIIVVPLMDAVAVTSAVLMSFIIPSSLMKYLKILDEFPAEFVEFIYFNCLMVALSAWR
jgi:hypothetical protein